MYAKNTQYFENNQNTTFIPKFVDKDIRQSIKKLLVVHHLILFSSDKKLMNKVEGSYQLIRIYDKLYTAATSTGAEKLFQKIVIVCQKIHQLVYKNCILINSYGLLATVLSYRYIKRHEGEQHT